MIIGQVVVDNSEINRLASLGDRATRALQTEIKKLTVELQNKVKKDKLTGTVLKVRTGTLRASIDQRTEDTPTEISGFVGTNLNYGIAHEFGVRKAVLVPAHTRVITKAFGKSIDPVTINVGPYTMNMNLPMRSFLRSSLGEFKDTVRDRIVAALKGVK